MIIGILASPIASYSYNNLLEQYQRDRISTFFDGDSGSNLSSDWNRQQSLVAIGSGQFFGKGFLNGDIVNSKLLPYPHTDFAFAALGEQFGFLGLSFLLLLYLMLLNRIITIASFTHSSFGKIIALGSSIVIFLNLFQHAGMNLGFMPITGVPLPLISSGGSSILTIFLCLGLVHSVHLESQSAENTYTKIIVN